MPRRQRGKHDNDKRVATYRSLLMILVTITLFNISHAPKIARKNLTKLAFLPIAKLVPLHR
jgi:hypothetical protein